MFTASDVSHWLTSQSTKGFLAEAEGEALYSMAAEQSMHGPCLEVGSYCGKSTAYLAAGCQRNNNVVFAVDHHSGSEEHQFGEEYHDPDLYESHQSKVNSLPYFQQTMQSIGLSDHVIPVISESQKLCKHWQTPLSLVFIDGGHSEEQAMQDCLNWSQKLQIGGVLAVHDLFEHPEEGGQGPYRGFHAVLSQFKFEKIAQVESLGFARRLN